MFDKLFRLLFNVSDINFIETLKHINFANFHKGTLDYKKNTIDFYSTLNYQPRSD
jgi:hypothetical protein